MGAVPVCLWMGIGTANPAAPAAGPAARDLGNYRGIWGIGPFANGTFEWGAAIAPFLSVLSVVPRHCAGLTHFLHPKLRRSHAVPIAPQPMPLPLRPLRRAGRIPVHACRWLGRYSHQDKKNWTPELVKALNWDAMGGYQTDNGALICPSPAPLSLRLPPQIRSSFAPPPSPSLPPTPPPPLPMFEADSQIFASAPSVPRAFNLENFRRAFGGYHRVTLGGGGSQPNPPPPLQTPPLPPF